MPDSLREVTYGAIMTEPAVRYASVVGGGRTVNTTAPETRRR